MKRLISLSLILGLCSVFMLPPVASAQLDPLEGACENIASGAERPKICDTPDKDPLTGTDGTIVKAANLIATVTGVAAVIVIILAGLQYITAAGEPNKVSGAKQSIIFAIVGVVIVLLARVIVTFIIRRF